jgi:hypothetical protein
MRTLTLNHSPNQIKATLGWMAKFRDRYKADPDWVELSRAIVRYAQTREEETEHIRRWIRDYVTYRLDPEGVEYLQDPALIMDTRAGDCDDMACLAGVLLAAVGHEVKPAGVVWLGRREPTHAVLLDMTSGLVCDPVSISPCQLWPDPPEQLGRFIVGA